MDVLGLNSYRTYSLNVNNAKGVYAPNFYRKVTINEVGKKLRVFTPAAMKARGL